MRRVLSLGAPAVSIRTKYTKGASVVTMRRLTSVLTLGVALMLLGSTAVVAVVVPLPDTSQTTLLTAAVGEQANVSVPSNVGFSVFDTSASTDSADQSVSATSLILESGHHLQISIKANAASFTKPLGGTGTWEATDVSWNAPAWTGGTGSTGILSSTAYNPVANSVADPSALSTTALKYTLAAHGAVTVAGSYTLACTWKFECVAP